MEKKHYPKFLQHFQMLNVFNALYPVLGQIERFELFVLVQIFDRLYAVLRQVQLGKIDQLVQVFDLR